MTATRTQFDPVQARVERAKKALAEGAFRIQRTTSPGPGMVRWLLENGGGKTYEIVYDRDRKEFACTCPDFEKRGQQVGTCKHIEAVKIWERQRRQTNGKSVNGTPKNTNGAAQPAQPAPGDPIWALVEVLREQNEVLKDIHRVLRQIDTALAQGLGLG